jgi:hypothetical protein
MKTKHGILFGFAVLLVTVIFSMAGCGNGTTDDAGYNITVTTFGPGGGATTSVKKGEIVILSLTYNHSFVREWDASFDASTTPSSTSTTLVKSYSSSYPPTVSYILNAGSDETVSPLTINVTDGSGYLSVTLDVID